MAPRASTRSQKQPRASQSQPKNSRKQREVEDDEDEEQQDEEEDEEEDMDVDEDREAGGSEEFNRWANQLARLALFTEQKRVPLKRDDISKKVLGPSNSRAFSRVFDAAQRILRSTFGMELVELRSRAELNKDAMNQAIDADLEEARKTGIKKKAVAAGSKTYILRSVLHPTIIAQANATEDALLEEEAVDQDPDDESFSYGSILSWSSSDNLGAIGVLYVVLSLILVNGRVMPDNDLRHHLRRLGLDSTSTVMLPTHATQRSMTLDTYLTTIMRQGYIDRQPIGEAKKAGAAGKGKRGRATQAADDDSGLTYEWRWGNRAASEVSEIAIARFVAEFMTANTGEDEENTRGSAKKVQKMYEGIAKAAGGNLTELK